MTAEKSTAFDRPYPLRQRFRRWGLPAALVTFVALLALVGFGGARLVEGVYLNMAEDRARVIDLAVTEEAPAPWRKLVSGVAPAQVYGGDGGAALKRALLGEVKELGLARLKVYNAQGVIAFSTNASEIGTPDASAAFKSAIIEGEKTVVRKDQPDGGALYELYVPLAVAGTDTLAVFELYESTQHLNEVLVATLLPAIAVPGLLLALLFWGLDRLVLHAQADIDGRARLVADLRSKLERMVSGSAVDAALHSVGKGGIKSEKVRCTLFYSDIRDFTGFAEAHAPEDVVEFLNRLMDLQVAAIDAAGGDVDKMIGDAVLARFDGAGAERRAISAAQSVLREISAGAFERDVGIGIFTGEVILGAIGGEKRMDFTVIGDSVNIAARLCSAAAGGELVSDADTISAAGEQGFGAEDEITVKGRRDALRIRRWSAGSATGGKAQPG